VVEVLVLLDQFPLTLVQLLFQFLLHQSLEA
jgi:hypothetical protein